LMDIATGEYTTIPNTHWYEIFKQQGYQYGGSKALPVPGSDTMFLVQSDNDCQPDFTPVPGKGYTYTPNFCMLTQDFLGNVLNLVYFKYDRDSDIKISWDQQYLAVITDSGDDYLRIFQLGGKEVVQVDKLEYRSSKDFSWLPDNRLILLDDDRRVFHITKPLSLSAEPERRLALPASLAGEVSQFEVSPSGDRIVFILVEENSSPWIMNLDDEKIRRLATSVTLGEGGFEKFGALQWSPDGQYIMFKEPSLGAFDVSKIPVSSSRYVIPAGDTDVVYKTSYKDDELSPGVIRLRFRCVDGQMCGDKDYRLAPPVRFVYWIP